MHASFEKIVRTKPKRSDLGTGKADKQAKKLRKQRREVKRYGGEL